MRVDGGDAEGLRGELGVAGTSGFRMVPYRCSLLRVRDNQALSAGPTTISGDEDNPLRLIIETGVPSAGGEED